LGIPPNGPEVNEDRAPQFLFSHAKAGTSMSNQDWIHACAGMTCREARTRVAREPPSMCLLLRLHDKQVPGYILVRDIPKIGTLILVENQAGAGREDAAYDIARIGDRLGRI